MASSVKYVKNSGGLVSSVSEEVFDLLMSRPPKQDEKGHTTLEFTEASAEEAAECDARENPAKGKGE